MSNCKPDLETQVLEHEFTDIKSLAAKICAKHNLTFIGFFQNGDRSYEKIITEGIDSTLSPGLSFGMKSFDNVTGGSEIQALLSVLLNDDKQKTSYKVNNGNNDYILANPNSSLLSSNCSMQLPFKNYKMIQVNPHNKLDVKNYLYNCFEEFQQIPCKLLAKAWIKIVEPKKQSKYPYKNGDSTKPFWWPVNAIHREPDHLKKDERISLLINILRIFKHRESELLYAGSLINGLQPKNKETNSGDNFGERKMELLKDMFKLVKSESDQSTKLVKVIKPGKKYSSQIYQKNKIQNQTPKPTQPMLAAESSILNSSPEKNTSFTKFTDLLQTPPPSTQFLKKPNTSTEIFPRPNLSTQHPSVSFYQNFSNELMQSLHTKDDNISLKYQPPNGGNFEAFLGSPFLSSKSMDYKINTMYSSKHDGNIDPNFFRSNEELHQHSFQVNAALSANMTPKNASFDNKNRNLSPALPPSGFFQNSKNYRINPLNQLTPSKLNSLNSSKRDLKNQTKIPQILDCKPQTLHKQTSTFIRRSPTPKRFEESNEETDYEIDD